MSDQQVLEGQEIRIRAVQDDQEVAFLKFVTSFNDSEDREIKQADYLGENAARFTDLFVGYSGDLEFHVNVGAWNDWESAKTARAKRETPAAVFEIVRIDLFSSGDNVTYTYKDVAFGATSTAAASRGEKVKVKTSFKCTERDVQQNAFV